MIDKLLEASEVSARLEPGVHGHAMENRKAIEADWAKRSAQNSHLFNGATVLATHWSLSGGRLEIVCREIDFATMLHWLAAYGRASEAQARKTLPPAGEIHFFASAAIVGSDDRVLVARMAAHTYNGGLVYMPSGSFEPSDFVGDEADFAGNMRREVWEETGIDLAKASVEDGYRVYYGGSFLAPFRVYRFDVPASELVDQANAYLTRGADDELAGVMAVAPGEVLPEMPRHVRAFMQASKG
ncbi:MAG: NUDIX hydrolase [Salaquimonas sp.]|nr:NUDIX hydrolase [Salaquimonas sp.]